MLVSILARFAILIAAALAVSVPPAGAQQSDPAPASQVREFEHLESAAPGHDLLYSLYLPPGYGSGERRFPTLYLLHGKDGNPLEWLHTGHLRETLDGLIRDGRVEPMIVVMPDGGGDSWYVDSKAIGGPGDYATAIGVDLLGEIDRTLRTKPTPRFRGIGGISMGGFGALRLAFAEPFRYGAAASFSGAFWAKLKPDSDPSEGINRIFNGSFGRPFNVRRFLAASPLSMIDRLAAAKDPPPVFLAVGDHDRFKLYIDTFELFRRMREADLAVDLRITGGDHEWDTWAAELPGALLFFDHQFRRGE